MRRNTVRLLKYLVFASVFVIAGPYTLRYLFGSNNSNDVDRDELVPHMAQGLPESPDVVKRNQGLHEDRQVQVNVLNLLVIPLMMHVNVIGISPALLLLLSNQFALFCTYIHVCLQYSNQQLKLTLML